MRPLYKYLEDLATPGNTIGMGNPVAADGETIGSEPLPTAKACRERPCKKRRRKANESLLDIDDSSINSQAEEYATAEIKEWIDKVYDEMDCVIDLKTHTVNYNWDLEVKDTSIDRLMPEGWSWGVVNGFFNCSWCPNLTSLKGAPKEMVGDFFCGNCGSLISLEGAPREVRGGFNCYNCRNLKTLKGAPEKVGWDFDCGNCDSLISLEGAPREVGGSFDCAYCKNLKTLEGAPKIVNGNFRCSWCISLKSLKGSPKKVGGDFDCRDCKLLGSLERSSKIVGRDFICTGCNKLSSLDGAPEKIGGEIVADTGLKKLL